MASMSSTAEGGAWGILDTETEEVTEPLVTLAEDVVGSEVSW